MRIRFCGSHGTGKTTLLNLFEDSKFTLHKELSRELMEEFWNPKEQDLFWKIVFQRKLFNNFLKVQGGIITHDNQMTDRSLIDILAYTRVLRDDLKKYTWHKNYDKKLSFLLEETIDEIEGCISDFDYDYTFYFPICFPLEKDGVRYEDEEFQKKIDNEILNILQEFQIPFIVIEGNKPEERWYFVMKKIGMKEEVEVEITEEDKERARKRVLDFIEKNNIKLTNYNENLKDRIVIVYVPQDKIFWSFSTSFVYDTCFEFDRKSDAELVIQECKDDLKIIFWIK